MKPPSLQRAAGDEEGATPKGAPATAFRPAPRVIKSWPIYLCGLAVTLVICALSLYRPAWVEHFEGRSYDILITQDASRNDQPRPVVVAIDDQSLARYGRWPWPRELVARLFTAIAKQRPAAVGVDAIFAEPERAETGSLTSHPETPGDRALAQALAAAPFVLGYEFTFSPGANPATQQPIPSRFDIVSVRRPGESDPGDRLWQANGVVGSLPEFTGQAASTGFLNAAEQEGILRRMPALIKFGGRIYPSLALSTVLTARGLHQTVLEWSWYGASFLTIDGRRIPLDERGRLLLRYRGWHATDQPVSAASLLDGRLPDSTLKGRVVFLGATATGMGEAVATPIQALISGVQVHAIAAENMLAGDFARPAPWLYRLLAVALLGAVSTLICGRMHVTRGALFLLTAAGVGSWEGAALLLRESGLFLSPVLPLLALLGNLSLLPSIRSFVLERTSRHQARELAQNRDFIVKSLTSLTEIRDMETGAHLLRTERYLLVLCRELSRHPKFQPFLNERTIEMISRLAPLHDIGKVGLPDQLLHKAAGFTDEEYDVVRRHPIYGRDVIVKAERRVGLENDELLNYAKDMAYSHHERWDGSGYPEGLKGEEIPWAGRVMAVADAYDAIISKRVYKESVSHDEAVGIIVSGKGSLFDPDVVEAFLKVEAQWRQIAAENADPPEEGDGANGEAEGATE
ncbi:CHASE2 domain-containing protein [Geomonas sp.]|uniref:CHASE2 domain-containing protein n=1 Tax=Geomonas sp. TaxID=2651584 RepID=UPI002B47A7AD|nr:CHASE2 domain-containing protein [Geomonas sp.]HJV36191.1 CHASE2 domain-containing protein [Geomonas sp.]